MFGRACVAAGDTEDAAEENSSSDGRCSDDASKATTGDVVEVTASCMAPRSWSDVVPDVCCARI